MMDDLRDYRFYKSDLLHPNELAINYIWKHFSENLFSNDTIHINEQLNSLKKALAHRPFQASSKAHQSFLENTKEKVKQMQENYKFLNFQEEIKYLQEKLK